MKIFLSGFIAIFLVASASTNSYGQCKHFTKKNCLPTLAPFIHNGQLTSASLSPGDSADVMMTFNADKEYRILTCSQEVIGNVEFKVLDKNRKVLYESEKGAQNPYWDFKVANTQQFIVQIVVPEKKLSNNIVPTGCVSILIGFKD